MENLATFLLKKSYLNADDLCIASQTAFDNSQSLVKIISNNNGINHYALYKTIAEFKELEFADLKKYPCDKTLLSADIRDEYLHFNAIPWKKNEDIVVIATSEITAKLEEWAGSNYNKYIFAITTPFDISHSVNSIFANDNDFEAREKLWQMQPECSAKQHISLQNITILIAVLFSIIALSAIFPALALATACAITSVFYASTLLVKTFLLITGYFAGKEAQKNSFKITAKNSELPIYTILIPLFHEEKTLPKLIAAIQALDYPKAKLDVKFIVEADDELTINAIMALRPPRMFEIIPVPYSMPRTKPKACNYALRFAKGEFVTIYDAEDIPEPEQLKKVLYRFASSQEKLSCVQARLNYFNRPENLLTRMFAIEYSTLFDFMLFGLEKLNIPIPLGGTSNHFCTKTLRELYAWDPYNVTEDADLGLRMAQKGLKCGMVWSLTDEEAPISLWAWIKQRTRWIKGHMQTYVVHMRNPISLYKKLGPIGFFGMQFFLGAPTMIFLISPIMWVVWGMFALGIFHIDSSMPIWFNTIIELSIIALGFGVFLQISSAIIAIYRNKWRNMLAYSLIFPFYWILHSVASFRALWQLLKCPHYWEKTTHGVTNH